MSTPQTPASSTEPSEDKRPTAKVGVKERVIRMRARAKKMMENATERELRRKYTECMKFIFVPGEQWDEYTKTARGKDRPMFEFNRARVTEKRVINGMRANRPQGKVRGSEDSDKDLAETREGILRNIANQSDFDSITDNAAEHQVAGGYAAWRVVTRYSNSSAWDQDVFFEGIRNPLCLWCDPDAFDMVGADAKDWLFTDQISKAEYKLRYPKAEPVQFEVEHDDADGWEDEDHVRIAEYWWKEPTTKTLLLLSDGKTIDSKELAEAQGRGLTVQKQREVKCYKIMSAIYSGDAELEPPTEFAGEMFPWVRVYGEYLCIEGKTYWSGLTPYIMDSQRAFNLGMTGAYESMARAPLSQLWATAAQAKGLAAAWANADKVNTPYQIYNHDPQAPGPPVRIGGAEVPVAQIQMSQIGAEEIKANSGIFDASLGNKSNEISGVALRARKEQSEITTFNFQDNMAKAVKRSWDIANNLIPPIYDTVRSMRILGADGAEKFIKVNEPDENGDILNDLSVGNFDITMTVGPSFATQRQEASEAYQGLSQSDPSLMMVAGDLVFKALDLPYADEIAERKKAMLPPPILAMLNKDQKQSPEVQQAMMQADQAMQQVQEQAKMVEAAAGEATELKIEAEKAQAQVQVGKAELQITLANIKTEEANFKTMQAQFETQVAEFNAKMQAEMMQMQQGQEKADGTSSENSAALEQIQQAAAALVQMSDSFLQQAAQVVMEAKEQPPIVLDKGSPTIKMRRVNGELVGELTYQDGTQKQVKASRLNGETTATIQ